jgi:SpoVK/Ycf46/Vps4 family AAA+-type ATPase
MATAQQIKTLLKSHFENNSEQFMTIALQVAAHEARQGHKVLAEEIKELIEKNKSTIGHKVIKFSPDLSDLILSNNSPTHLSELIVEDALLDKINRIIREYIQKEKIKKYGLSNRRKILLTGNPGTGKTMTASVLANELKLPLYIVLMDKLVTKFMGETGAKLRQIFEKLDESRGVYLFDEFDAIGSERSKDNDVGEMRRVLNAFLQFIEHDKSESYIVAATNNVNILDQALFRRFDDIFNYSLPDKNQIKKLISNRLGQFLPKEFIAKTIEKAASLSHAEICQACDDSIKEAILSDKKLVSLDTLSRMLEDRRKSYGR